MTKRSYRHALDDMLAAMEGIERATAGKSLADYQGDWLLRHAFERAIEIVSEASRAVPDEIKALRPERAAARISRVVGPNSLARRGGRAAAASQRDRGDSGGIGPTWRAG